MRGQNPREHNVSVAAVPTPPITVVFVDTQIPKEQVCNLRLDAATFRPRDCAQPM